MNDQIYEINIKRFIQSTEFQLNKLKDCISRLKEVSFLFFCQNL